MKNFILLTSVLLSFNLFGQDTLSVTLCEFELKNQTISLTQEQLNNCRDLKSNNDDWTVTSFNLSFQGNNMLREFNTNNNRIRLSAVESIKKYAPEKVFIEKIVLTNTAGKTTIIKSLVLQII